MADFGSGAAVGAVGLAAVTGLGDGTEGGEGDSARTAVTVLVELLVGDGSAGLGELLPEEGSVGLLGFAAEGAGAAAGLLGLVEGAVGFELWAGGGISKGFAAEKMKHGQRQE